MYLRILSRGRYLQFLIAGFVLAFASHISANECLDLMPYDTVADGLPKICQSDFNGVNNFYSCQDYYSDDTGYRVLYRGGNYPKAIVRINTDGSQRLISAPLFGDNRLNCPLKPPAGIPEYAIHRGTGICYDDNDQMIACSIFEHAAARQFEETRFMTFYTKHYEEPVMIDAQFAGNNTDAMVAELAYQIGMALWDTECCAEQAVEYLAQAYQLFPRAEAYKKAYRHSRATLAIRELSKREQWD